LFSYLKEILTIISGVLTPIIAAITVFIAFQQYKTSRYNIKLDLYDKRFLVFLSLMTFITKIVHNGIITTSDLIDFYQATNQSYFLFDDDINNYIKEVHIKSLSKLNKKIYIFGSKYYY
jgi:hypothetical protein